MKQLIPFVILCLCLSGGYYLTNRKCPEPKQCDKTHYLDSIRCYISKSSLNSPVRPVEYREKYPGVYELVK